MVAMKEGAMRLVMLMVLQCQSGQESVGDIAVDRGRSLKCSRFFRPGT